MMAVPAVGVFSCLHIASQNGNLDSVKLMVEKGGKDLIMLTDAQGSSCLCIAAQGQHSDAVRLLVGAGGR